MHTSVAHETSAIQPNAHRQLLSKPSQRVLSPDKIPPRAPPSTFDNSPASDMSTTIQQSPTVKYDEAYAVAPQITASTSDTSSIAASSRASSDCACTCHAHSGPANTGFLSEEWIANNNDGNEAKDTADLLDTVLDSLFYQVENCSSSRSSCPSCYAAFANGIESALHRIPDAIDALQAVEASDLYFLGRNLHTAQIMKGLASAQLQRAVKIFRSRIRDLKVHELLYSEALRNFAPNDPVRDDAIEKIDQQARVKSLKSLQRMDISFCHGSEFALLPTFGITPNALADRLASRPRANSSA
ncbi:hypothetical protein BKA70DRAFT_1428197 [Coprinopsis sp. MPI-PUGE-AT-0042]|nr:hypothetical protein BKA70DRAFT_1428197 [Coprinopsis sp. MPI-PUGE-AT-0042]